MAVAPAVVGWIGAATAVVGTVASIQQNASAGRDRRRSEAKQDAARGEQQAQQSAEAAQARRQQMRESRVKRAQILNSAANTGTQGSSGEGGAVGGLNTQASSNVGLSEANIQRSQRIGVYNQESSNFMSQAHTHSNRAGMFGNLAQMGMGMMGDAQNQLNQKKPKASLNQLLD